LRIGLSVNRFAADVLLRFGRVHFVKVNLVKAEESACLSARQE